MRVQNKVDFLTRNADKLGNEVSKIVNELPQQNLRMALAVLIVVPIAFAYPFFQRFIISGITVGSVKG
jgi:putative aldouronate transport system permease protein